MLSNEGLIIIVLQKLVVKQITNSMYNAMDRSSKRNERQDNVVGRRSLQYPIFQVVI